MDHQHAAITRRTHVVNNKSSHITPDINDDNNNSESDDDDNHKDNDNGRQQQQQQQQLLLAIRSSGWFVATMAVTKSIICVVEWLLLRQLQGYVLPRAMNWARESILGPVASGAAAVVVALFITALVMIGLFWGYFMLLRYPQSQNNNSNHEDKGKDDEKAKLGGGQQSPPPSPLLSPTWTLFSIYCVGGVLSLLASRILTTAADDNGERHFLLHSLLSPSSSPLEFIALLIRAIQIIFISPLQEEIIFRWVILRIVHQQYLTYYNHLRQAANTNTSSTINNSNNNNNNKEADQQPPPQSWIITSILISSCLFSFVHLLNVFNGGGGGGGGYVMIQSVLAGVTGLAFAVASLIEEPRPMMKHSIPPTLKLHVLNNVMALLFFGAEPSLGQDGGWWMATSCPFLPCTSSKLTFDLIICLCWLLLLYYSKTRLTF